VAVLLRFLGRVIKVGSSSRHGKGSGDLAEDHQEEADADCDEVDVARLVGWQKVIRGEDLEHGEAVCDIVWCAVGEEEEATGADDGDVVSCCDPELEEVEQSQGGDEGEGTPDGVAVPGCLYPEDHGCGKSDAQPERLSADAGERSLAFGKQGWIEWKRRAGEWTLNIGVVVIAFDMLIFCCSLSGTTNTFSFRGRGGVAARLSWALPRGGRGGRLTSHLYRYVSRWEMIKDTISCPHWKCYTFDVSCS